MRSLASTIAVIKILRCRKVTFSGDRWLHMLKTLSKPQWTTYVLDKIGSLSMAYCSFTAGIERRSMAVTYDVYTLARKDATVSTSWQVPRAVSHIHGIAVRKASILAYQVHMPLAVGIQREDQWLLTPAI